MMPMTESPTLKERLYIDDVTIYYGKNPGVKNVTMPVYDRQVTALIGPSGCGKTTLLRALNRMHDLNPIVCIEGQVRLDGENIYDPSQDPVMIRRRIGMVFQRPTPFPTQSVFDNVVAGLKLVGTRDKKLLRERAEEALKQAALWEEVKDRLNSPAMGLSGGQQQRLSVARALAVKPEVLLMDEPTSALDPGSTQKIEDLLVQLKNHVTIVIVTHNMQQAQRISDFTGFFYVGNLIEFGASDQIFTAPKEKATEDYITGRFG